jgi:transcriptional regulator with XRE-family HTH domain
VKTFGREARRLRRAGSRSVLDLAQALGVSAAHLSNIERGSKTCGGPLAERMADVFTLTGEEREQFLALRVGITKGEERVAPLRSRTSLPLARVTCEGGCDHDAALAPGGSPDGFEREGECAHYGACLRSFAKTHKGAAECHCPPACSHRQQEVLTSAAVAGWGSMTFPDHGEGKGANAR